MALKWSLKSWQSSFSSICSASEVILPNFFQLPTGPQKKFPSKFRFFGEKFLIVFVCRWKLAVVQLTAQYELLVKILLTPAEPMHQFVQSYILLLTDSSSETFTRILAAKGVTKSAEQQLYLDEFNKHVPPTPSGESFLKIEATQRGPNWSDHLMARIKDLGLIQLRSYSRSKEIREPRDGNISPIQCQPFKGDSNERGL